MRAAVELAHRMRGRGLGVQELLQIGTLALMKAPGRHETDKDVRFASYARRHARVAIQHELAEQGRVVRSPFDVAERTNRWRAWPKRTNPRGREPSICE